MHAVVIVKRVAQLLLAGALQMEQQQLALAA